MACQSSRRLLRDGAGRDGRFQKPARSFILSNAENRSQSPRISGLECRLQVAKDLQSLGSLSIGEQLLPSLIPIGYPRDRWRCSYAGSPGIARAARQGQAQIIDEPAEVVSPGELPNCFSWIEPPRLLLVAELLDGSEVNREDGRAGANSSARFNTRALTSPSTPDSLAEPDNVMVAGIPSSRSAVTDGCCWFPILNFSTARV